MPWTGRGPEAGGVRLGLVTRGGSRAELTADHVIAATGYRSDLGRLAFLGDALRARLRTVAGTPVVGRDYQSSVPGLFFAGPGVAPSFGPVMRFVYGTAHAAPCGHARAGRRGGPPGWRCGRGGPVTASWFAPGRAAVRLTLPLADLIALACAAAITGLEGWRMAVYVTAAGAALAVGGLHRPRICLRVSDQAGRIAPPSRSVWPSCSPGHRPSGRGAWPCWPPDSSLPAARVYSPDSARRIGVTGSRQLCCWLVWMRRPADWRCCFRDTRTWDCAWSASWPPDRSHPGRHRSLARMRPGCLFSASW